MAGKPSKPMTPFDKSVTPSYLYKWKLFLAFLPPSIQRFLAVYIKFTEFRYTMDYFRGLPFHAFSFQSISELAPYMDENERDMMNQMTSVMQMAEMMAMAQAGSTTGDPGASGPASPVDLMKAMMSGEDMEMFQNYMKLFDEELSASGSPAKNKSVLFQSLNHTGYGRPANLEFGFQLFLKCLFMMISLVPEKSQNPALNGRKFELFHLLLHGTTQKTA